MRLFICFSTAAYLRMRATRIQIPICLKPPFCLYFMFCISQLYQLIRRLSIVSSLYGGFRTIKKQAAKNKGYIAGEAVKKDNMPEKQCIHRFHRFLTLPPRQSCPQAPAPLHRRPLPPKNSSDESGSTGNRLQYNTVRSLYRFLLW